MGKFSSIFDEPKEGKRKARTKKPAGKEAPAKVERRGRPAGHAGGKRSDPNYTQLIAYVTKETHAAVKVALAPAGEISELVQGLLDEWLRKRK